LRSRKLFGVDLSLRREATVADFMRHQKNVAAHERQHREKQMRANKVETFQGVASFVDPNTVRIAPDGTNAGTSKVGSLTSNNVSNALDLTNNDLVIDYTGASPAASILGMLTTGYNAGAWNGAGINSSIAAAAPGTALGWAEATDIFTSFPATFSGQSVDDSALLLRYTAQGDANLDGTTDTIDFNILATNFSGNNQRWFTGDFNYDTSVDTVDFNLLTSAFGQTMPAGAGRPSLNLVPEPTSSSVTLLALALLGARESLARRCRRSRQEIRV
jgi:hypothetical protein